MKDKFGRELQVGDICFKVKSSSGRFASSTVNIERIQEFSETKVKIGDRRWVDSRNLILASAEGLDNKF